MKSFAQSKPPLQPEEFDMITGLSALINANQSCWWITDEKLICHFANRTALRFFHKKKHDLIGQCILKSFEEHPEIAAFIRDSIKKSNDRQPTSIMERKIHVFNKIKSVEMEIIPLKITKSAHKFFGIQLRDISSGFSTENEFDEFFKKTQPILDEMKIISMVLNQDKTIYYISPFLLEKCGYRKYEVLGKNWFDIFIPPDRESEISAVFKQVKIGSKEYSQYANPITTKDKQQLLVYWNNFSFKNSKGQPAKTLSLGVDITEEMKSKEELEWELKVNKALANVSKPLIAYQSSLEPIIQEVLKQACKLTDSDQGFISIIDVHTGENIILSVIERDSKGEEFNQKAVRMVIQKNSDGNFDRFWGVALNSRQAFFTNQPKQHHSYKGTPNDHAVIHNFLSVPALIDKKIVGQICLGNSPHGYQNRHLTAIERMADLYALAIIRLRINSELTQRNQEISLLYDASQMISRTLRLEKVMAALHQFITNAMDCKSLIISEYDHQSKLFTCVYASQEKAGVMSVKKLPAIPLQSGEKTIQSQVIISGKAILTGDYQNLVKDFKSTGYYDDQRKIGYQQTILKDTGNIVHSAIIVPIKSQNRVIGIIQVFSYKQHAYKNENLRLVESIALHIGAALQNIRLYERSLTELREKKAAEKKLREYSENLEKIVENRTKELKKVQDELHIKEKMAVIGQLAGGVAHELRNPLGVINNSVYLLKLLPEAKNKSINEYLEIIQHEVFNAQYTIDILLDFAKQRSVVFETIKVEELIVQSVSKIFIPTNIKLQLFLQDKSQHIRVDPLQIEHVINNLVDNAIQAMPEGGKISIRTSREMNLLRIEVKDTGCGISQENLKKIFEPLFTTKTKGIGLGLTISKTMIEANHGSIQVESGIGKGTTFILRFPIVQ